MLSTPFAKVPPMLGELTTDLRMLPWLCESTTHNRDSLLTQLAVVIAEAFDDGSITYIVNATYVKSVFAEELSDCQKFN